jgi:hypothetical protein
MNGLGRRVPVLAIVLLAICPLAAAEWDWNAYVDGDPQFNVTDPAHAYWQGTDPIGFRVEHTSADVWHVAAWKGIGALTGDFEAWVELDNLDTGEELGIYLAEDGFDHLNPDAGNTDYMKAVFGTSLLRGNTLGWGAKHDDQLYEDETYSTGHPIDGDHYAAHFGRIGAGLFARFYQFTAEPPWTLVYEANFENYNPEDPLIDLYLVSNVFEPVRDFGSAAYGFTKIVITPEPAACVLLGLGLLLQRRR